MRNKIIGNLIWAYGERFFVQLITLIVTIVLARILPPLDFGMMGVVLVFVAIGDALATSGFASALVQKKVCEDLDYDSACWLSTAISVALYFVLFFSSSMISKFYNNDQLMIIIRIMGIRVIVSSLNSIQQAYVQRNMLFRKFFWATIIGTVVSGGIGIYMAYDGYGVMALAIQSLSNSVIDTIVLWLIIKWKPKFRISIRSIKELWQFGSKIFVATLSYTIKDNIRSLIIGKKFSSSDLAFYNQGKRFPSILVSDVVEVLGKVLFPALSREQNSYSNVKTLMRKSIQISSFILTPLIVGLFSVADSFVDVILTEKWQPCVPFLRILCLVYVTRSINTILQKGLLAVGKSGVNLVHEVVTSILTIVLLLLAAFKFESVKLIAWSYVLIMIIGTMIFSFYANKYLHYSLIELCEDFIPSLLISMLMGILIWGLGFVKMVSSILLISQIVLGISVYYILARLFKIPGYNYLVLLIDGDILKNERK